MAAEHAAEGPDDDEALREKLVKVPIAFPEDLYEWLRREAFDEHTKMAVIVRQAVKEYRNRAIARRESRTEENR
jgi:hypothetical protein